ncbi:MAG: ABC transporter substrate-binding protein [Actinobacteria bacterium]|nr:ABC transporter substrate-binding protein [Actinomycetota bacterium]
MKRRWSRRTIELALITAMLVLAGGLTATPEPAAAADASPSTGAGPAADTLRIGIREDPANLSPYIGYNATAFEVFSLQYDYLFAIGPDGQPQTGQSPLAAEDPTVSADGTVWTVRILPDVRFTDGTPLTAEDVAFSYNYVIDNEMWNYTSLTAGIERVEAVDPTTVRIVCAQPKPDMLSAGTAVPIVPKHIWEKVDPEAALSTYANDPPIVGSGPFQVVEYKPGKYVRLVRNPEYREADRITVDEVYFMVFTNPDTMVQELKAGTIDAAVEIPRAQFMALEDDAAFATSAYNILTWVTLNMNTYEGRSKGNPVLRDRDFRLALATAIDREQIIEVAYGGFAEPGTTIVNPDTYRDPDFHWQPPADVAIDFDLAEARAILDAAGYKDTDGDGIREGDDGKPIRLRLWVTPGLTEDLAQGKLLAGWWKQIGLDIRLEVLDTGAQNDLFYNYDGDTYVPDYDMYMIREAGYLDPGQNLPWYTTAQIEGWNGACWSNAEYDRLSAEQASEMDPRRRAEIIWRMQQIMYEQVPIAVLVYPTSFQAYNIERWEGWQPLSVGGMNGSAGPVVFTSFNYKTYRDLKPLAADTGGDSRTGLWIGIGVAAAVVVALVAFFAVRSRRGGPAEEE